MLIWTIIKVSLKSLMANKMRSFLAMLGIIIGVGAVISMMAMGTGAQQNVMKQISSMGTNLLVVRPGQRGSMGIMSGSQQNLTLLDVQAILDEVKGIGKVAPVVGTNSQLKYMNKNTRGNVIGTTITYFPIRNFEIERGRSFSENEAERMARVAVLGPVTADNLFGTDDPIGQTIKLKGINFRVVGVMKSKGDQGWFNPDDQVIISYITCMKQLMGIDYLREIDIQVAKDGDINAVQAGIEKVLRRRHRIQEESTNDFMIQNQAEILATASSVTQTFSFLISGIAGISLLVGGIGIMNIMLVTVTERIREIGIRKAIGAKDRDILRQFLLEAMLMSGLGGFIGVAIGAGSALAIGKLTQFVTVLEIRSIILALSVSAGVGIFFGYYPARRAAMLDPIEALRYE